MTYRRLSADTLLRVRVGALLATEGSNDVDEPPVVLDPPLGATGLLFLSLNLRGLTTHLTGTGQRSVDLSTLKWDSDIDGGVGKVTQVHFHVQGTAVDVQEDVIGALALGNSGGNIRESLGSLQVEHVALAESTEVQLHVCCCGNHSLTRSKPEK